ncbi:DUF4127 family protein [Streptomyces sp. NPDC000880]
MQIAGEVAGAVVNMPPDSRSADAVVAEVGEQDPSRPIGLADVRYANGSDPALVRGLLQEKLIDWLTAYGGWNTAGNSIGSVVAALVAAVVGGRLGSFDRTAARKLLLHRLLEDFGYQAVVRAELCVHDEFRPHVSLPFDRSEPESAYMSACVPRLTRVLKELDPTWQLADVRLPWHRTFEIDFELRQSA